MAGLSSDFEFTKYTPKLLPALLALTKHGRPTIFSIFIKLIGSPSSSVKFLAVGTPHPRSTDRQSLLLKVRAAL